MPSLAFSSSLAVRSAARSYWTGKAIDACAWNNLTSHILPVVSHRSCSSRPLRITLAQHHVAPGPVRAPTVHQGKRLSSMNIRKLFLDFYEQRGHTRKDSASLVPDDPTILLTIAGMVPFKPIFVGSQTAPDPPRATSSQKCIRTNDIENVGVTKRHHTFFEMLGNFSFGDYFKRQAIIWAWELLTSVFEIPPERLAVSVFENDDEAFEIWRDVVGVPEHRIRRMGEKDNFWASGPTGPCGPCSEIYYDFNPISDAPVNLEDDERFVELYNLVFMQYSRGPDGELTPLDTKNIDTGMGLERVAQVLQGVENNYETDLIRPIIDAVAEMGDLSYETASAKSKVSLKVTGDHIRAVAHLIADGVRASNTGRGYIVRRLIRRIVRHGRLLGIDGPFISSVLPVVANLADEAGFQNISAQLQYISSEISREESRFLETLERGKERLDEALAKVQASSSNILPGTDAFELFDTYGYPLELVEEIAAEHGFSVDRASFEQCMNEQRVRARSVRSLGTFNTETTAHLQTLASTVAQTRFVGYTSTTLPCTRITGLMLECDGEIVESAEQGQQVRILLTETPFYAEGGGQVGDKGILKVDGGGVVHITDTRKEGGAHVHIGMVESGSISVGDEACAEVEAPFRRRIQAHHTATHLLQAALNRVFPDGGISQAGSLVDAEKLRFDFNCASALSKQQIEQVEQIVNSWIDSACETSVLELPIEIAKQRGAIAMFGEKYGAMVRVIEVPGISMELCGGTHVKNIADIGLFKVVSESGPSAGVRRIEAVCGAAVLPYLSVRDEVVRMLCMSLKARPEELPVRVSALQQEIKSTKRELDIAGAELVKAQTMALVNGAVHSANGKYVVAVVDGNVSMTSLRTAADELIHRLGDDGVVLLGSKYDGKASFACTIGPKLLESTGLHAGKLVGAVAEVCGGGGGGRPNMAQAGGKDGKNIRKALDRARGLIEDALQVASNGSDIPV